MAAANIAQEESPVHRRNVGVPFARAGGDSYENFDNMNLLDELIANIHVYGMERPTPIQQRIIVPCLQGLDVIAQSQPGTGKTTAAAITILQKFEPRLTECQTIVLVPTREAALQMCGLLGNLGDFLHVRAYPCFGGQQMDRDGFDPVSYSQVLIGTPGRIADMISRDAFPLSNVKCLLIDAADELLLRGFKEPIESVTKALPDDKQVIVLATTMPAELLEYASRSMRQPLNIWMKNPDLSLKAVKQFYVCVQDNFAKIQILCAFYAAAQLPPAVVYCNTTHTVELLSSALVKRNITVAIIHYKMDHSDRNRLLREFRCGSRRVLLTTDLVGRSVNIQEAFLVINFDLPIKVENYIERVGCKGPACRREFAINMITKDQHVQLDEIEKFYGVTIERLPSDIAQVMGSH